MKSSAAKPAPIKSLQDLKPVQRRKLYREIVDQIRGLIKGGRLKHGDRLPPERELAEIFQVSRNSVREAIRSLEEKGIVTSRPGAGTYVTLGDEDYVVDQFASAIGRERDKLSEIFEFRRLVEPHIAYLAAQNAVATDLAELEDLLQKQAEEVNDRGRTVELDQSFHLALARASKSTILLRIVETLNDILEETRAESLQGEARSLGSLQGHRTVLEAIKQRNSGLARRSMNDHLKDIERMVFKKLTDST